MPVHVAVKILHLRFYEDGVDVDKPLHEMTENYYAHTLVTITSDGTAYLEGMIDFGGFNSVKIFREILKAIKPFGVYKVQYRHKNKDHILKL